ncbi:conjugal transfer protein TraG N-terminal domain-containing protein [Candidatus Paracaedibacter symbiosus]|uniref:conjugal transfer protein TraG N-terminal domain-containing protein n=1 Tax=Candidatus Paracaedibacter symbiosus TaxID=244582 RepID=UPI00050947DC|nr:conjugal transfer protein TraG N-terminal domain-containing protein [Candidatus Paracaedibacter symbiosus]
MSLIRHSNAQPQVIGIEVNNGMAALSQSLFGSSANSEEATQRLNQYFGDAWGKLAKGSSDAAALIQQELMLNSYREALQDKRDELGLGRSEIEMAHLNAARGIAHQDSSFLVKAVMSGTLVPVFHTIIFALALIYFSMMAPMTFLPRGTLLLVQWVKVMLYLATWPALFAMLNCIGQMFAVRAMATKTIGYGEGLTLLTQSGMADIAHTAYLTVIGLQLSVPFLAWTLLWGGGYAFSQMASSFTQSGESFAAKAGSETVDGNVSFDTQSLHTRSIANTQMAQQQLGPSLNFGSRVDDGKLATLYGPGGQVTMQEHQTNLGTNVSQNDAVSTMLGMQSAMMQNSSFQQTQMAQTQFQMGLSDLVSVGNTFADNKSWTDTIGNTESGQAQRSFSQAMKTAQDFAKNNNIDLGKSVQILTKAGMDAGAGVGVGKNGTFASLSAALGAQGSWITEGGDKELLSKAKK